MDAKKVLDSLLKHWAVEVARLREKGTEKGYPGIVVINSINRILMSARMEVEEQMRKDSPLAFRADPKQAAEPQIIGEAAPPRNRKFHEVLLNIKSLTEIDLKRKSVFELLASMGEEVGEFSRELKIEERTYGNEYKKPGDENSRDEAVDMIICALSLYFARNGNTGDLGAMINKKLAKWEKCQGMANMPGLCPDCGTVMEMMPLGGGIRDLECPRCAPESFKDI